MSEQDIRERLEADVRGAVHGAYAYEDYIPEDMIIGWLDRQAAITEREQTDKWQHLAFGNELLEADKMALQDSVDELTAERDELQAAIDAMENGQFYAMYKAKCEECEQLKKVVRTQADSFKSLEIELSKARGEQ